MTAPDRPTSRFPRNESADGLLQLQLPQVPAKRPASPITPDTSERTGSSAPKLRRFPIKQHGSKPLALIRESPWQHFKAFHDILQGGPAQFVYSSKLVTGSFQIGVIQSEPIDQALRRSLRLQAPSHQNIAPLVRAYLHEEKIYFVYEPLDVSLDDLRALPSPLAPYELAAICSDVAQGLHYIHRVLKISHGEIGCHTIFVSRGGAVQIGELIA